MNGSELISLLVGLWGVIGVLYCLALISEIRHGKSTRGRVPSQGKDMWTDVRNLWQRDRSVHGLELLFDTLLLVLRRLSVSYWIRTFLPKPEE